VRLFEHGARFLPTEGGVGAVGATREVDTLAGVACGHRLPEQWGLPRDMREPVDFFDVKGDGAAVEFTFEPGAPSCLHPGRSARIRRNGEPVGWLGELHPSLVEALDFTYSAVLFEL